MNVCRNSSTTQLRLRPGTSEQWHWLASTTRDQHHCEHVQRTEPPSKLRTLSTQPLQAEDTTQAPASDNLTTARNGMLTSTQSAPAARASQVTDISLPVPWPA
eukprot:14395694-Alexandrium_andersonii.AAC.1